MESSAGVASVCLNLRTVCEELTEVVYKWKKIGVQLGVPHYKLMEFKSSDDPLMHLVDYWLKGNVEGVSVSWNSIVKALRSRYVQATGLANKLEKKYCKEDEGLSTAQSVASLPIGTNTTSSGSTSTFDLPDVGNYFPYSTASGKISEAEHSYNLHKLYEETEKVKRAFGNLLYDLERDLEMQRLQKIVRYLELTYPSLKRFLTNCKDMANVTDAIEPYCSFFNFEMVKSLIRKFSSSHVKERFRKYKKMFEEYSRRRVIECPTDAFGDVDSSEKVFVLKTDKILETLTADELKSLQYNIEKILKNESLRLMRVKSGCTELTFRGILEWSNISGDEQQALREEGVLSIKYGDKYVDIAKKFVKHSDPKSSDIKSDSGYSSQKTSTVTSGAKEHFPFFNKSLKDNQEDFRINMMASAKELSEKQQMSSPLVRATVLGNEELVKRAIEDGANPFDTDKCGSTLLHYAVLKGRLNVLKCLIEDYGCNPATENGAGANALHFGAQYNQLDIVKYLVEECQMDPSVQDKENCSPLTHACRHSDLEMVVYLVESTLKLYMSKDTVYYGDVAPDWLNVNNPLSVACLRGHLPIVKYLVEECGCDPSKVESGTKSPLVSAVCSNHIHVVKYLASTEKIKVFRPKASELSLVDIAVEKRSLEMVKFLTLSMKCDPIHIKNGVSTLHAAAKLGLLSIVKHLCSLKCDPNIRGWCGRQPIHMAAVKGHLDIVKYLVENQRCHPSSLDYSGTTPLYLAASDGHLPIVRYLTLKHNCDPMRPECNSTTSLDAAIGYGHLEVIKFFVYDLKCKIYMVGRPPPIYYATIAGNLDLVNIFMDELGCKPRTRQQTGLLCCQLPVLKYLREEKEGAFPISKAEGIALSGKLEMVEHLSHVNVYTNNPTPLEPPRPLDLAMYILSERRYKYTVDKDQKLVRYTMSYDVYMTIGVYIMHHMGKDRYHAPYSDTNPPYWRTV